MTGLGYCVAIATTVLAPYVIRLIFGAKFDAAIDILRIQAWTAPIVFSGSVRAQFFLLENITIYHTSSALLGIAANFSLSLWLLPQIGAKGAAVAALVGYWLAGYVSSLLFSPLHKCARLQTNAFLLPIRLPVILRSFGKK